MPAMSVHEIYEILREHNALIVHFSSLGKNGATYDVRPYPDDLRSVLNGNGDRNICCSTVKPTDSFHGIESNAVGCIGIVVGLRHDFSVVAATPCDAGSIWREDGTREVECRARDLSEIEDSITQRPDGTYNEWVVSDFSTIGILAVHPFDVSVHQVLTYPSGVPDFLRDEAPHYVTVRTCLQKVRSQFANQRIFTFHEGLLWEYRDEGLARIDHADIYGDILSE